MSAAPAEVICRLFAPTPTPLGPEQCQSLAGYLELLLRWSRRINLTGFRDLPSAAEGLLYDAAFLAPLLPEAAVVLDVGAGAGGLGVALVTARPDLSLRLVEPRAKRAAFLRVARRELSLGDRLEVIQERAEALEEGSRCRDVDAAYAQAVMPPARWLELCRRLLPPTASSICLTARPLSELIELAPEFRLAEERRYQLPSSGAPRVLTRLRW